MRWLSETSSCSYKLPYSLASKTFVYSSLTIRTFPDFSLIFSFTLRPKLFNTVYVEVPIAYSYTKKSTHGRLCMETYATDNSVFLILSVDRLLPLIRFLTLLIPWLIGCFKLWAHLVLFSSSIFIHRLSLAPSFIPTSIQFINI